MLAGKIPQTFQGLKKDLKDLDPSKLSFSEGTKTFINKNLYSYYKGIWNKCNKLWAKQKLHQFYTIDGIVRVKLEENGAVRSITHVFDLVNLFQDTDIDSQQVDLILAINNNSHFVNCWV